MTVAVPTKNNDAFSPPDLKGCTLTSFAGGSSSGTATPLGRSRVAGWLFAGSKRMRCIVMDSIGDFSQYLEIE